MNVILLSGGSGTRLWPISTESRPKQFIQLFEDENGNKESILQRVYRQINKVEAESEIVIATTESQVNNIKEQLGDKVSISIEPCLRDTFPAIALATLFFIERKGLSLDDVIVVSPVDSYVEDAYFESLAELSKTVYERNSNLGLIGVTPSYPSEKYGYIIPCSGDKISKVQSFKEKPVKEAANQYISQGGLWNAGVFCFRAGYMLNKCKKIIGVDSYEELLSKYDSLNKISFDYAVSEKDNDIICLRTERQWRDIGTWNTLSDTLSTDVVGNAKKDASCINTTIVNELNIPILCIGLENVIVAASTDGIIVMNKDKDASLKEYLALLDNK